MDTNNSVQALLEQLRQEFIADLPDRINDIEGLILKLDADNYEDLYRLIHSLKGSAGTHGLHIISTICHHFEDSLVNFSKSEALGSKACIAAGLDYIDILKQAVDGAQTGNLHTELLESRLHAISKPIVAGKTYTILLAEKSKLYCDLITDSLGDLPAGIVIEHNGFSALEQLLIKKFDILITASELPMLNGEALIAANKLSHGINKAIFSVLLTSKETIQHNNDIEADFVIKKNMQMHEKLHDKINRQLKYLKT